MLVKFKNTFLRHWPLKLDWNKEEWKAEPWKITGILAIENNEGTNQFNYMYWPEQNKYEIKRWIAADRISHKY